MTAALWTSATPILDDGTLLIVDKPSGLLSHPNPGPPQPDLCVFSGHYQPTERLFRIGNERLWLIHRIDQDTSGLLWAARTAQAAVKSREIFESKLVTKRYLTLLTGHVTQTEAWSDALETSSKGTAVRVRVRHGVRPNAHAKVRRIESMKKFPSHLVEVELITGRTHQIRAQAAHRRHPVAGDDVYGDFAANKTLRSSFGLKRMFLHAASLEFPHPVTGKITRLNCPLPQELEDVLARLRGH